MSEVALNFGRRAMRGGQVALFECMTGGRPTGGTRESFRSFRVLKLPI